MHVSMTKASKPVLFIEASKIVDKRSKVVDKRSKVIIYDIGLCTTTHIP